MPTLVAAESVLVAWLKGAFADARVSTETPASLGDLVAAGTNVIQVVRFGGADSLLNLDAANIDVDTYGATRELARNQAEAVRASLRLDLPGQTVAGGFVAAVATISAPTWTPYDNTNVRRFTASYRITIRSTI